MQIEITSEKNVADMKTFDIEKTKNFEHSAVNQISHRIAILFIMIRNLVNTVSRQIPSLVKRSFSQSSRVFAKEGLASFVSVKIDPVEEVLDDLLKKEEYVASFVYLTAVLNDQIINPYVKEHIGDINNIIETLKMFM
uniref:Uncharacterized protein n=1 Tax=Megaselia scalaris TaxID=36166 RepID=T1GLM8_MEGSC